jgi:hypothetical protein
MSPDVFRLVMVLVPLAVVAALMIFVFLVVSMNTRRSERKAARVAEILKIYAEKGEAPPQSVIDALTGLTAGSFAALFAAPAEPHGEPARQVAPLLPPPKTRSQHFSWFASNLVLAAGAAGIIWWRSPAAAQHPDPLMNLALAVALIFAAGAAYHLVAALQMRDGR